MLMEDRLIPYLGDNDNNDISGQEQGINAQA